MAKFVVTVEEKDPWDALAGCAVGCCNVLFWVPILAGVGAWWTWSWDSPARWWCIGICAGSLAVIGMINSWFGKP
jgi:hypothetical protein